MTHLNVRVEIANFGETATYTKVAFRILGNCGCEWKSCDERLIGHRRDIPIGKNFPLGKIIRWICPSCPRSTQAVMANSSASDRVMDTTANFVKTTGISGFTPRRSTASKTSDVLVTSDWADGGEKTRRRRQSAFPARRRRSRSGEMSADEKCPGVLEHPDDRPPAAKSASALRRHARPALRDESSGARGIPHRQKLRLAVDATHQRCPLGQSLRRAARAAPDCVGD